MSAEKSANQGNMAGDQDNKSVDQKRESVDQDGEPADYPDWWQTYTVLSDGATIEIRPIKPSDRAALADFHSRQSQESIYFRFFRHRPELSDRELDFFTQVDYDSRMAFIAIDGGQLVAVARYEHGTSFDSPPAADESSSDEEQAKATVKKAEVAFFVDDANHGRGLATLMLEFLAAAARANGFGAFTASVLPENYRMLGVFRAAGFTTKTRFVDGVIDVAIDLRPTAEASLTIAGRLQQATSRSLEPLLHPEVVAIVGAGRKPGSPGHELFVSALGGNGGPPFGRPVLAINPNTDRVEGQVAYPTLMAAAETIDEQIDLAVLAVPADQVPAVVEDCGQAGVHGMLIIASGFDDRGGAGIEAQRALVKAARGHGMRLIGPNAFGVANTDAVAPLNLLSVPIELMAGPVGLASDSGLLAAAVIDQFRLAGVGVSQVVGLGNQADVSVADLVAYWALDEKTKVVVLYNNQQDGERSRTRSLAEAARSTSMIKPVVAVNPADDASARLLAESGVILVDAVRELADQAALLACQPIPRGRRVAIVSNSASLARLSVMACRRFGLDPTVPASARQGARKEAILVDNLDSIAEIFGPTVAVSQAGSVDDYESVIVATAVDHSVDALFLALLPTEAMPLEELGRLADRINRSVDKPVVVVGLYDRSGVEIDNLPFYPFPEEAARALSRSAEYGEWRQSIADVVSSTDDANWITEILSETDSRRLTMADPELAVVGEHVGIPLADYALGTTIKALEVAARRIGYPVVLKLVGGSFSIGESGGTAIDLHDRRSLRAAYDRMSEQWGPSLEQAVVQRHVAHQLLARLDVAVDDDLGPSLSLGLGGSGFESVEPIDRTFLPTSGNRLLEMVEEFRTNVGPDALSDIATAELAALIETVAALASSRREVRSLSLNPILVGPEGAVPVNMELELAVVDNDPLDEVRRLS